MLLDSVFEEHLSYQKAYLGAQREDRTQCLSFLALCVVIFEARLV